MRRRKATTFGMLSLAALLIGLMPMDAAGQSLAGVEERLSRVGSTVENLRTAYLQPLQLRRAYDLANRSTEARVRYLSGDFDGASILFLDIVETPSFQGQPGYDDAVFFLAESLFQTRNYALARSYYERSLQRGTVQQGMVSAQRVLEISFRLRDFRGLDEMYATLQQRSGGQRTPELNYIRGKALYFQGQWEGASNAFASVPPDADIYPMARYFLGVTRTRMQQWGEALRLFDEVTQLGEGAAVQSELFVMRELAWLGIARVHYELRDYEAAERAYLRVGSTSERYDSALYELAWTRVNLDQTEQSVRQLEILAIVGQNGRLLPEAALLRGDLLLRLQRYDEAQFQFGEVAETYMPVEQELDRILNAGDEPGRYYRQFVDSERGEFRVPSLVRPWFQADESSRRSLEVVRDLRRIERDLEECTVILSQLDNALANPIVLFERWREGWGAAVGAESQLLDAWGQLADERRRRSESAMSGAQRSQYEALRSRRVDLERQYRSRPRSFEEMNADAAARASEISRQRLEVYRAQQALAQSLDELEVARRILERAGMPAEERRAAEAELEQRRDEFIRQQREAESMQRAYQAAVAAIGVGDAQSAEDLRLRRAYRDALREELGFFDQVAGSDPEVARMQPRLMEMSGQLDLFFNELLLYVSEQTTGLRADVEAERVRVARLAEEAARRQQASVPVVGAFARRGLEDVRERFGRIALRANLGGIDVAWREKERLSTERETTQRDQVRALRALEMDFAEIRGEQ